MSAARPISVVLAVHDGMPYLPAALESVLAQTYTDFELLVIDDHSTDATQSYLSSISDPRLRVLSSPEKGLTAALNFGLAHATGDWIARMDSDDWCFPERFARQIEAAQKPGVVMISANYELCDEELQTVGKVRLCAPNPRLFSYLRKKNNPFCHPLMMFHRQTALDVGGYRYERAQDYDLWIRLLARGRVEQVDAILLKYRVRRQAISIRHVQEQAQSREAIKSNAVVKATDNATTSAEGQYAYRLGFAAWLSGHRCRAGRYFMRSLLRGNNAVRCLIAMGLMWLPHRVYLALAGYRGVFCAGSGR